jgi:hypothetical protein
VHLVRWIIRAIRPAVHKGKGSDSERTWPFYNAEM